MNERPDLRTHLQSLTGQTIETITGKQNTVLEVKADTVLVGTGRSPEGKPVPIAEIEDAYDELMTTGEVVISPESVGYRSAFIGAVLSSLPDTESGVGPPVVKLKRR